MNALPIIPKPVVASDSHPATLAIDIGGTRIKAGVVVDNTIVDQLVVPTDNRFDRVLATIVTVSQDLIARHSSTITVVGLSVPGILDVTQGIVVDINKKLDGLVGFPIVATLTDRLGLPVFMENDARLHGLGEMVAGAARGVANMVCLTFGTGIGCCVAIDGYILRGPRGTRAILGGHMTIEAYGPPCTCGSIGCFEALCRAAGLVDEVIRLLPQFANHPFHNTSPNPEQVLQAAAAGDPLASAALEIYRHHIAVGVTSYINIHDPDVVLLGGGMMNSAAQILPYVQEFTRQRAWTYPRGRVPVRTAALGDQAALVGAAALARGEGSFL